MRPRASMRDPSRDQPDAAPRRGREGRRTGRARRRSVRERREPLVRVPRRRRMTPAARGTWPGRTAREPGRRLRQERLVLQSGLRSVRSRQSVRVRKASDASNPVTEREEESLAHGHENVIRLAEIFLGVCRRARIASRSAKPRAMLSDLDAETKLLEHGSSPWRSLRAPRQTSRALPTGFQAARVGDPLRVGHP